jgi:hypothetical protein
MGSNESCSTRDQSTHDETPNVDLQGFSFWPSRPAKAMPGHLLFEFMPDTTSVLSYQTNAMTIPQRTRQGLDF